MCPASLPVRRYDTSNRPRETIRPQRDFRLVRGNSPAGSAFEFPEGLESTFAACELPHPPHLQPSPLSDEDPERIFDILVTPIHQLHHDRMLRVRDWEGAAPPSDPHRMPDRVLRPRSRCGCDVHAKSRKGVMDRAVGSFGTGISQVFRADLEAPAAERFGQAWRVLLAVIDYDIHIRRRPRNAKSRDGKGPDEDMLDSCGPERTLRGLNDRDERAPLRRHLGDSTPIRSCPPSCRA